MSLKLDNIYYRYNKRSPYILNGTSYEFFEGESYAITGSSGSGKTTLMAVMARLDKLSGGTIYFDSEDTAQIDADKYRSQTVSVIFQNYNLLYNNTAIDNIEVILRLNGMKDGLEKRAHEFLTEVGIPKEKQKYLASDLSGGEQQRIAIARALAANSKIILADEPTGNLDKVNSSNIMEIFQTIKRKYNRCVIIVTHSDIIASACDHILFIRDGKLFES